MQSIDERRVQQASGTYAAETRDDPRCTPLWRQNARLQLLENSPG